MSNTRKSLTDSEPESTVRSLLERCNYSAFSHLKSSPHVLDACLNDEYRSTEAVSGVPGYGSHVLTLYHEGLNFLMNPPDSIYRVRDPNLSGSLALLAPPSMTVLWRVNPIPQK
ncbi:hypothetical protein Tco_1386120 [Tanacetum coccineum]